MDCLFGEYRATLMHSTQKLNVTIPSSNLSWDSLQIIAMIFHSVSANDREKREAYKREALVDARKYCGAHACEKCKKACLVDKIYHDCGFLTCE
ncbi:hypothetical protein TELCIR_09634 [Teladorsagia circumcincta]|uniref:Uncharacterized protein n=1 Tax=Teladorsagia circumcincta TaxID=45464 RepID=A0A2G9UFS4_TELCI|nr:hypothetical protein TELCIR_09634 [Teladorsagia circumcincta]